jgi:hypothetical protein
MWDLDLGPPFWALIWTSIWDTPIWDPDLGPRFKTLIWDPDLGHLFGTLIWDPDLGHPDLGHPHLGPRFGTPIWDPNVISKIKQNSSDMNEIILAPCDVISKIKQNSSRNYAGHVIIFYMIESMIIRYLSVVWWKRLPPINDLFFGVFFRVTNSVLGQCMTGFNINLILI